MHLFVITFRRNQRLADDKRNHENTHYSWEPFVPSWNPFLWGLAQTFFNGRVYVEVYNSFRTGIVVHEMRYLRLYEGCLESVPQILIQTYYIAR